MSGYAYVANMPTVLIDPSGLTSIDPSRRLRGLCLWCGAQEKAEELVNLIPPTVGGCVGASGGLGVGGFFELCLVSSNGALGVTVSGGTGFQTPSLSANLGGIGSNAQSVCDLTGWAGYAGASAGPGLVSVGLDSTVGRNAARRSIVTTTASVGLGFPTPPPLWFEHHGGLSRTWAIVGCDRSSPAGPSAGAK